MALWIEPKDRMPAFGRVVKARLRHWNTKAVVEEKVIAVDESDCSWRTADDHSEISYNWDIVGWLDEAAPANLKGGIGKSQAMQLAVQDMVRPKGTWREFWTKKIRQIDHNNRLPRGFKEPAPLFNLD